MSSSDSFPLISVLLPAYNHQEYVQESIKSVVSQTYPNIELLIIDDGSSDETWAKICELEPLCKKTFSRVVCISRPNKGRAKTFNELLQKAQGKYVFLIASDDVAEPHAISTLYGFLSLNPEYVLAVGDNKIINEIGDRIFWDMERDNVDKQSLALYLTFAQFLQKGRADVDFFSDEFGSYSSLVKGNYIPNGYLLKRDAMLSFGGFAEEAPLEDWYQHLQLAKCGKFKFVDEILFAYRWHGSNTVKDKKYMTSVFRKTLAYEKQIVDNSGDAELRKKFYDGLERYGYWQLDWRPIVGIYKAKTDISKQTWLYIFGFKLRISG